MFDRIQRLSILSLVEEFITSYKNGKVCLHPTDTLPGLTLDPFQLESVSQLYMMKNRPVNMPCISLVSSSEMANKWWRPLPAWLCEYLIGSGWPEGLSIAWQANKLAPSFLVSKTGTICLRKISANERLGWVVDVINQLDQPLLSTSVNKSGVPPLSSWDGAREFVLRQGGWVPDVDVIDLKKPSPSTVVAVNSNQNGFDLLREGAVDFKSLPNNEVGRR